MKTLVKKAAAMLTATLLMVIASQFGVFAQGEAGQSMSPGSVIGGVALIIGLVVLLAVKKNHRISSHHH